MKTVKDIINYYDNCDEIFSESSIVDEINKEIPKIEENDILSISELYAFQFVETNYGKSNNWGTYYGPFIQFKNDDGSIIETPNYKNISVEMLKYWELRAIESKHPILKSRYADLVWDFAKVISGKNPDYKMAHIVIENNMLFAKKHIYKYDIYVIHKLKRALELALSLRDTSRSNEVKTCILDYEDTISEDDKPGLWGFSFDLLLKSNRQLLSNEESLRIIDSLEKRITRLKTNKNSSNINPWAIEGAANRLADYYKSQNRIDDVKRVINEVEQAFMLKSQSSSPLQKMAWLESVHSLYSHFSLRNDADRLKIEIKKLGPDVIGEMKEVSGEVNIPKDKIEEFINNMISGDIEEILTRIAIHYIPNKDDAEKQLRKLSGIAPLSFLMTKDIVDEKGRSIARIGSIDTDLEGNIVHKISQDLSFTSIFLRYPLERLESTKSLNLSDIENFIFKSPLFEDNRKSLISNGIESYLKKDFISSIHILIPQIENALRLLIETTGGTVLKATRSGGFQYKTFDELLRDDKVINIFGYDCSLYFRVLFTDQRGWNIRNNVCHGIAPYASFNQSIADRIFHSILIIGLIRNKD